MQNTSLAQLSPSLDIIMRERIEQGKKEISRDKKKVWDIADEYNKRFQKEIEIGTKERQLLLQEHANSGNLKRIF
jgi:hypothetical protein